MPFASYLVVQTQVPSYELVLNGFELVLNGFELVLKSAGGILWGDSGVEEVETTLSNNTFLKQ
jgi:hypothetical protein